MATRPFDRQPVSPARTPALNPAIARTLRIKPPMTEAELQAFCRENATARIERTRGGLIEMNPPAGSLSSDGNAEVLYQLRAWWKEHRRGRVYDSSAGFYLPDGSLLSPDASYLTEKSLNRLTREQRKGFPHVCPEFIVELLSETDSVAEARRKMELWIVNGVHLGWLIVPEKRQVLVYEAGAQSPVTVSDEWIEGSGPVAGFRLNLNEVWDCY